VPDRPPTYPSEKRHVFAGSHAATSLHIKFTVCPGLKVVGEAVRVGMQEYAGVTVTVTIGPQLSSYFDSVIMFVPLLFIFPQKRTLYVPAVVNGLVLDGTVPVTDCDELIGIFTVLGLATK
jgi:hypothetical protein